MREWDQLGAERVDTLRRELLGFVAARSTQLAGFVINTLLHTIAVMYKRSFFQDPQRIAALLMEQSGQLLMEADLEKKGVGMALCAACVGEFSSDHSTAVGLPLEFHLSTHKGFEELCLTQMFGMVVYLLKELMGRPDAAQPGKQKSQFVASCAKVLETILDWEFPAVGSLVLRSMRQRRNQERQIRDIRPGAKWTDALARSGLVELLAGVYMTFRGEEHQSANVRPGQSLRFVLVQLACLQGEVFPQEDPSVGTAFAARLWAANVAVLTQPLPEASGEESQQEQVFVTRILQRLLQGFGLRGIFARPDPRGFLERMTGLTCKLLLFVDDPALAQVLAEGSEAVLGAWEHLLRQLMLNVNAVQGGEINWKKTEPEALLPAEVNPLSVLGLLQQCATAITQTWVRERFKEVVTLDLAGDEFDAEEAELREEDARRLACIARINAQATLGWLQGLLVERCRQLEQIAANKGQSVNGLQPVVVQGELRWLLMLMTAIITDPLTLSSLPARIPRAVFPMVLDQANATLNDCTLAAFQLLDWQNKLLGTNLAGLLCEATVVQCLRFLLRWQDTYLQPNEGLLYQSKNDKLPAHYPYRSGGASNKQALDFVVTTIYGHLRHARKRNGAVVEAAVELLDKVVSRDDKCDSLTPPRSQAWWAFVEEFGRPESPLMMLEGPSLGRLMQAMCQVCAGKDRRPGPHDTPQEAKVQAPQVFARVVAPLQKQMQAVLSCNVAQEHNQPDWVSRMATCLVMLRGVAKTSGAHAHDLSTAFLCKQAEPLVAILGTHTIHAHLACNIIKLVRDIAATKIMYMDEADTRGLVGLSVSLARAFVAFNTRRMTCAAQHNKQEEAEQNMAEDLEAVLELLANILVKEAMNKSVGPFNAMDMVADGVRQGLQTVMPCLTLRMLAYREVTEGYYTLLEIMAALHPQHLASLEPQAVAALMQSLEFALGHHESEVVTQAASITRELAGYDAAHNHSSPFAPALAPLGSRVLKLVLTENLPSGVLDSLADALLPVILADTAAFYATTRALVQAQASPSNQQRLHEGFEKLLKGNGLTSDVKSEKNTKVFRGNFRELVVDLRALLLTK